MEPSNSFDHTYGPNDVSAIYILKAPGKYLNVIEQDCIASFSKKYLLNSFVGGNEIAIVNLEGYRAQDYLLPEEQLIEILKDL